ncbi:AAA family ATPase [Phytohalomonas tamaricis]|uniref:AAA family ATPase n=1 Tax=Phytohalomonas tamaricis TaxID=2081032 RepID=UPI000D0B5816|nr:AAA family ATPase [Phytohalomonas tamaricis]
MKLLAIRLNNLASLAGHHELDFTQGALHEAGLFAITGPTGAGKSTLLDALCLALFGSTPRLRAAPTRESTTPDIDGEQLVTSDPRTLLRRGEASGFAEVDFEGRDGYHYRSRWAVRRARNKAEGKLQSAEQSLIELPDERVVTAQKREFDRLLPEKLGLSFDQFTRAVLLAQAEFSAFLKANDNERSELLEKLTDTAIYSRISVEAYRRIKAVNDEIKRLETRMGGQIPASPERRAELEDAAQRADSEWQVLQRETQALSTRRAWFEQEYRLRHSWEQAQHTRNQAERQQTALESQRALALQLDALAPQRPLFQQQREQRRALAAARTQREETAAALDEAIKRHDAQRGKFEQAEAALFAVREARHQAQPALDQAIEQEQQCRYLDQAIKQLVHQQSELERKLQQADQNLDTRRQQRDRQQRELDALERRLGELDSPEQYRQALQEAQDRARERLTGLGEAQRAWQQYQRLGAQHAKLQEQQTQDRTQLARVVNEGKQAKIHMAQAEAHDRRLRESIEQLRAVRSASVEKLRAQLHEHEPCPVCGALDHPYTTAPPPSPALEMLEQIEREEERQLADARHQCEQTRHVHQELSARYKALKAQLEQRQKTLSEDEAALVQARQVLEESSVGHEVLAQQESKRNPWLTDQLSAAAQQRDDHQQLLGQFDQDQRNAAPLRQTLQQLEVEIGRLDSEAGHYRQQLEALNRELTPQRQQHEQLQTTLKQALGNHARVTDWRDALERRVNEAEQTLQRVREAMLKLHDERQQLSQRLDYLKASESEHDRTIAALEARLNQWRSAHDDIDDATLERLLAMDEQAHQTLSETLASADQAARDSALLEQERASALAAHRRDHLDAALLSDTEDANSAIATLEQTLTCEETALAPRREQAQKARDEALHVLRDDDRLRRDMRALESELDAARSNQRRWGQLAALIGAADGKAFRRIAQAYNLERLIEHANLHLKSLARRYRLARGGSDLGLLVIDTEMGDEQRSVHSLSGGETFLVSLALALGLASMASHQLAIETLFIDEGFGSLDPQSLHLAMDALDGLQAQGRKVGVISHVQEMHERIPVQVRVRPLGNGASSIDIVS